LHGKKHDVIQKTGSTLPHFLAYNRLVELSTGKKTHKVPRSPWYFVTLPEEERAKAIGNMHKKLVKIACVDPEISSRTDRHRHTHHNTSQFLPWAN